jgi:hypothetical protein
VNSSNNIIINHDNGTSNNMNSNRTYGISSSSSSSFSSSSPSSSSSVPMAKITKWRSFRDVIVSDLTYVICFFLSHCCNNNNEEKGLYAGDDHHVNIRWDLSYEGFTRVWKGLHYDDIHMSHLHAHTNSHLHQYLHTDNCTDYSNENNNDNDRIDVGRLWGGGLLNREAEGHIFGVIDRHVYEQLLYDAVWILFVSPPIASTSSSTSSTHRPTNTQSPAAAETNEENWAVQLLWKTCCVYCLHRLCTHTHTHSHTRAPSTTTPSSSSSSTSSSITVRYPIRIDGGLLDQLFHLLVQLKTKIVHCEHTQPHTPPDTHASVHVQTQMKDAYDLLLSMFVHKRAFVLSAYSGPHTLAAAMCVHTRHHEVPQAFLTDTNLALFSALTRDADRYVCTHMDQHHTRDHTCSGHQFPCAHTRLHTYARTYLSCNEQIAVRYQLDKQTLQQQQSLSQQQHGDDQLMLTSLSLYNNDGARTRDNTPTYGQTHPQTHTQTHDQPQTQAHIQTQLDGVDTVEEDGAVSIQSRLQRQAEQRAHTRQRKAEETRQRARKQLERQQQVVHKQQQKQLLQQQQTQTQRERAHNKHTQSKRHEKMNTSSSSKQKNDQKNNKQKKKSSRSHTRSGDEADDEEEHDEEDDTQEADIQSNLLSTLPTLAAPTAAGGLLFFPEDETDDGGAEDETLLGDLSVMLTRGSRHQQAGLATATTTTTRGQQQAMDVEVDLLTYADELSHQAATRPAARSQRTATSIRTAATTKSTKQKPHKKTKRTTTTTSTASRTQPGSTTSAWRPSAVIATAPAQSTIQLQTRTATTTTTRGKKRTSRDQPTDVSSPGLQLLQLLEQDTRSILHGTSSNATHASSKTSTNGIKRKRSTVETSVRASSSPAPVSSAGMDVLLQLEQETDRVLRSSRSNRLERQQGSQRGNLSRSGHSQAPKHPRGTAASTPTGIALSNKFPEQLLQQQDSKRHRTTKHINSRMNNDVLVAMESIESFAC